MCRRTGWLPGKERSKGWTETSLALADEGVWYGEKGLSQGPEVPAVTGVVLLDGQGGGGGVKVLFGALDGSAVGLGDVIATVLVRVVEELADETCVYRSGGAAGRRFGGLS